MNKRMEYQKGEFKHVETFRTKIIGLHSQWCSWGGVQIMWLPQAPESKGQQNRYFKWRKN